MELLRTPESRFQNLSGYDFAPHYLEIPFEGQSIRMHYLDEGDPAGETVLLLHGQPSWSYLYRKVIPPLVKAGYRVVAPDLIGFGKSDKPSKISDFTYDRQEEWLRTAMFDILKLRNVTLYAQDWGGLLSLRIVGFHPEYFDRVMIANTGLPVGGKDSNFTPGDHPRLWQATLGAKIWKAFARWTPYFPIGKMAQLLASESKMTAQEKAGYDAPFPSNKYMAAARAMPQLIPLEAGSHDSRRSREAWKRLAHFDKPFRTAFSDKDFAIKMLPTDEHFQKHVPGAQGQGHLRIQNAGHFLQEDQGEAVAKALIDFMVENPIPQPNRHSALP
jgi:haloalkane dehalogenase